MRLCRKMIKPYQFVLSVPFERSFFVICTNKTSWEVKLIWAYVKNWMASSEVDWIRRIKFRKCNNHVLYLPSSLLHTLILHKNMEEAIHLKCILIQNEKCKTRNTYDFCNGHRSKLYIFVCIYFLNGVNKKQY